MLRRALLDRAFRNANSKRSGSLRYRTFGLDLKPGKEEMVSARLGRLVSAGSFRSFHEYARHVAADSTGAALAALIDALATNHTSFLRERDHFDFFRQHVAPDLARRVAPEIWCAACSTGEEVWTLACVWNDAVSRPELAHSRQRHLEQSATARAGGRISEGDLRPAACKSGSTAILSARSGRTRAIAWGSASARRSHSGAST